MVASLDASASERDRGRFVPTRPDDRCDFNENLWHSTDESTGNCVMGATVAVVCPEVGSRHSAEAVSQME